MFKTIKNAWSLPDLRKKILFTLLIIVVFRIGSVIQVPFLDTAALRSVMNPDDWSNTMLSYMNTLSGGAFSNATLFAMGITPYINSSIIIQLLCVAIPPLERLAREGEAGRRKISAITRYVTVGLGIIQGTAYYFYLLNSKVTLYNSGFELWFSAIVIILVFTALSVGLWIYRSIAVPLVKLKKATKNIKEGNLDFVLEVEGNDEFSQLCQDFEEMRKRLKESTEEKILMDKENKELISNISHDLKTPITAVKGYVEGIMDGVADTPEKMDRYVRTIYNKTNEMDHLINELTFYSKIDTNRIPYTFSKLNVEDYFSDCAEEVGLELETRGIQLCYANYVDKDVLVIADGEQIRRVIHNIISNAIKYMDKQNGMKGIIQIRVKDVGDFVQVEIEDNGKGIAAKDLPYIFDRFYRTDVSRNSSKGGSGIGLSIVRKIMEDHGGKVWATSREGIGTIMYFVLRKYQEVPMK